MSAGSSASTLPEDVRNFIRSVIDGLDQLEVLLLLSANGTRDWEVTAVAAELRLPEEVVADRLRRLVGHGLLAVSGTAPIRYRFAPRSPELEELTRKLAAAFRQRRVAVITEIFSKPASSVQVFADAFVFRRNK